MCVCGGSGGCNWGYNSRRGVRVLMNRTDGCIWHVWWLWGGFHLHPRQSSAGDKHFPRSAVTQREQRRDKLLFQVLRFVELQMLSSSCLVGEAKYTPTRCTNTVYCTTKCFCVCVCVLCGSLWGRGLPDPRLLKQSYFECFLIE